MHPSKPIPRLAAISPRDPVTLPLPAYPWKTRILIPATIVIALIAVAAWSVREAMLPVTDVRVMPTVLRPVQQPVPVARDGEAPSSGGVITQAAGWVEPDPYPVAISALADGIVHEVLVLDGQRVKAGEVVARLIDDDARLALRRAEAELAARQADLRAAERSWENPTERRRAVETSRAMLEEARAQLAKLDADIAVERAREAEFADLVHRLEQSVAARASGESELAAVRFKLEAQRAQVASTAALRPVLEATVRQRSAEATSAEEAASLRIEETRALDSAKAALMLAQTAVDEARLRLSRMEIRSPREGVILTRLVEPGAKLMLGIDASHSSFVARLYDPSKLQVRVDVPLADAHKVGVGSPADISVEAVPRRTFRGTVTHMVNEADIAKNTIQFKVRIDDPDPALKPEMLARVKFTAVQPQTPATNVGGSAATHLPFVPRRLIRGDGDSATVILANRRSGVAEQREITLEGTQHHDWVAVSAGISPGDDLVADPPDLAVGARIRVIGEAEPAAKGDR